MARLPRHRPPTQHRATQHPPRPHPLRRRPSRRPLLRRRRPSPRPLLRRRRPRRSNRHQRLNQRLNRSRRPSLPPPKPLVWSRRQLPPRSRRRRHSHNPPTPRPPAIPGSFRRSSVASSQSTASRSRPAASPAPSAPTVAPPPVVVGERDQVVPLSKIRKLTGAHMVMSLGVSPHAFSVVEVDFANVDATRSKIKNDWKSTEGFSLTYLGFIARAIVDALREFPHLNATVDGDNLVVHNFVDLGIAVDLEYTGLLVPLVRNAETKRLRAIAREIYDLANRAKSRKLSP